MVVAVTNLLWGCRLSRPPAANDAVTTDPDRPAREDDNDELKSVPVSLWSPSQRQASAGYYFLAGEMLMLRDEPVKALNVFEAAYGLDPNPIIASRVIGAKARSGRRGEAEADAHKMVLLYPKDPQLRFLYGEILLAVGRWQDAADQFQRALELDPSREAPYILLAASLQAAKKIDKAITVLSKLVKQIPGSVNGWSALARLNIGAGRKKDALVPAQRAYELRSNDPENALVLAIAYELNNRAKDAIYLYEQLYRLNPVNDQLTARMVAIYQQLGNLEDALALLDETERVAKESKPGIRMQRAIILWELKRNAEADKLLEDLLKEHPESDRVRFMVALSKEKLEKPNLALEIYASIKPESPFRVGADFRRAIILKEQKRFAEAEEVVVPLMELAEPLQESYILAAQIFSDAGKHSAAAAAVDKGYANFPENHRLLFLRGVYEEKAGDYRDCIETMKQVIAADPFNSSAFNFLGYLYAERGEKLEEAERLIRKAIELKPDDGYYLDSLGWVLFQRGKLEQALEQLEKAVKLEPDEGVIWEHIAVVQEKRGKIPEASKAWEKALASKSEGKDRKRIEELAEQFRKKHSMTKSTP